jgi:8-oxo-dGTP pyrophosphatase MutT (NUDIX family)
VKIRKTARAVLLDPQSRVLLFEFVVPEGYFADGPRRFWATAGGEIDPGEDVLAAVVREVREETGIQGFEVGPDLWYGSNQITFKGVEQKTLERFFVVRSPTAELGPTNWTEIEKEIMRTHRWWTVAELLATEETIFPPRFGYWVDRFLKHGTQGPEEIPL